MRIQWCRSGQHKDADASKGGSAIRITDAQCTEATMQGRADIDGAGNITAKEKVTGDMFQESRLTELR